MSAGSHDAASAERAVRDLLALPADRRPTALFTANNRNTVGALRALRDGDGTVALVGFDDFELADMLPVPVTVVRHDPAEMGRIGAEMAYLRLDGDDGRPQRRTIDVRRRGPRIRGAARAMTADRDQAPAQPDPPLLPRRPGDRRAARDRRRRRPFARGVDRLGVDALRRERARAEPHARRRARPRRAGRRPRGVARRRARRALRRRAPRCWSSCWTPASACPSTTIPTARSRTSTSGWTSARPRRGSSSRHAAGAEVARRLARRRRGGHAARLGRRAGPRRPARRAEPPRRSARATRSSSPPACPTPSATAS